LPQNLKLKVGQTGTLLRAGYRSRDAIQIDTVYSPEVTSENDYDFSLW